MRFFSVVVARVDNDNDASIRAIKEAGFVHIKMMNISQ